VRLAGDRAHRELAFADQALEDRPPGRVGRVRLTLEELPQRQAARLVRAMGVIIEIFARDALTNLLER
jgi:hypothetical protein